MSAYNPPDPYFNGINYNNAFFSIQSNFITLTYATKTFLNKITGGIISGLVSIIYSATGSPQLVIQNTNASSQSSLLMNNNDNTKGMVVGIGNTNSSAYQNQAFIEAGVSTNLILNAGGYSATPEVLIDTAGNVGIGTGTTTQKLTVNNGALQIIGASVNPGNATSASFWNQALVGPTISGANIAFNTSGSTEAVRILANGNFGIGTNNPLCKLSLGTSTGLKVLSLYDVGNDFQYVGLGASSGLCFNTAGTGDAFQFRVGTSTTTANEVMRITGSGNVGVGITNPNCRLHLHSTTSNTEIKLQLTDATTGTANANGFAIIKSGTQEVYIQNYQNTNLNLTTAGNNMIFSTVGTERMRIDSSGNVGIGTNNPTTGTKLDVRGSISGEYLAIVDSGSYGVNQYQLMISPPTSLYGASIQTIRQGDTYNKNFYLQKDGGNVCIGNDNNADVNQKFIVKATTPAIVIKGSSEADKSILYLATPNIGSSAYKCALIAEGLSSFSRSKFHICLNNTADNTYPTFNAGTADACFTVDYNANCGVANTSPINSASGDFNLCVGNSSMTSNNGTIIIGKKITGTSTRHFRIGLNPLFDWCIGDYGNNNTAGSWIYQLGIAYAAPLSTIYGNTIGQVYVIYNPIATSDIKVKTDIRTIDNALWKVQQLRGVYYKSIIDETENIGLIAQETEYIIPEAVRYNEHTDTKGISYGNLTALLINAIKEQQEIIDKQEKQIENIMYILSRNSLI